MRRIPQHTITCILPLIASVLIALAGGCGTKSASESTPVASQSNGSKKNAGYDDSPGADIPPLGENEEDKHRSSIANSEAVQENEFQAIAARLIASENRYLGRGQIPRLQREQQLATGNVGRIVNVELQLCWNHLRLGNIDAALNSIDAAFKTVVDAGGKPQASMHKLRALVFLREAEFRNCVRKHNRDCCVLPLQGGGVHSIVEPMQNARRELLQLLAIESRNLEAVWLLNICSQALGDYPNAVPEPFRIPPSAFDSDRNAPPLPKFVDIASELGVNTFNLCGGAIIEDFNGDDLLDIATSTYDPSGPLQIYDRQKGTLSFTGRTMPSQLGGLNTIAADYDGDGDMDMLVLRGAWLEDEGQIRNSLLQNDGTGKFRDVSLESGIANVACPTQAAVWGDFDMDGDLDLYIGNESRAEIAADAAGNYPSELYQNNGDGTFTEIAKQSGVTNDRYCKGVAAGDYDNDGDLDLYVSNRGRNRLYENDGNGNFKDVAHLAGVIEPQGQSFACWFFDYDNDGWLDLFVAAYQSSNADVAASYIGAPHKGLSPCLYRNLGDGTFRNVTAELGLDRAYLPMGANFGDIDNDGFLDVYLTTGRPDFATLTPNVMLRNDDGRRFQDVTTDTGLGHLQKGHGVAFADIDDDGDQDIYHQLGGFYPGDKFHNAMFENRSEVDSACGNHFLNIKLVGLGANRRSVGARIRVTLDTPSGPRDIYRAVGAVSSFGGSPLRQAIGLGDATAVQEVTIDWPRVRGSSPLTQTFRNLPLDRFIQITQGESKVIVLPAKSADR